MIKEEKKIPRRKFIKTAAATGAAILLSDKTILKSAPTKKKYVIVGTGSRSGMYQDAIEKTFKDHAKLVGFCDTNPGRLKLAQSRSKKNEAAEPPAYEAKNFDRMIAG